MPFSWSDPQTERSASLRLVAAPVCPAAAHLSAEPPLNVEPVSAAFEAEFLPREASGEWVAVSARPRGGR